jgi:molybdopterin/thiamine biosynthesis adenylyltransferase
MSDPLFIDDDDRYGRLRLISWWDQKRLANARVLVVGAGALGNEVLKNLALVGVGTVYVVDFDRIEPSNLARSVLFRRQDSGQSKADVAAAAIREINPDIQVSAIHGNIITDVGLGLFRHVDLVIGCLDNREARLWVNRQCWKVGTPWIDAGIQEINGVVKIFVPPDSACYECAMTENDYRLINLRYSCPLLTRDDLLAGKVPTAPTIASMIAGLQVQEALKLLHGMPVSAGKAHIYNGVSNQFYTTAFQRREECLSHESYVDIVELPFSAETHSAEDLMGAVCQIAEVAKSSASDSATRGSVVCHLNLDRDLVVSLDCACGLSRSILKPASTVSMRQSQCERCGQFAKPLLVNYVERGSRLAQEKLSQLGVPPFDVLRVSTPTHEWHVLLARDGDSLLM